jgi:phosphatidylglycerophosphate synthase
MAGCAAKLNGAPSWRLALPRLIMIEAGFELTLQAAIVAAVVTHGFFPLTWRGMIAAASYYLLMTVLVFLGLQRHVAHRHFGLANAVTLCRAAFNAILLAVAVENLLGGPALFQSAFRWQLAVAAAAALVLDGVDGWVARRSQMASAFGARFDVETDAVFLLGLALTLAGAGIVGPWVLASGLIYYLFRIAGQIWPPLAAPLFPSWRRKAICVAQGALMIAALAPATGASAPQICCIAGLSLLIYSFAVDIAWLIAEHRGTQALNPGRPQITSATRNRTPTSSKKSAKAISSLRLGSP